ncbi:MAG TPA: endonuclease/exonuclease/phosphatase family protein [Nocardioides sp.]|nr:endonuclease/exonuclease/phosphatase family protein [Nocardioides sp.]
MTSARPLVEKELPVRRIAILLAVAAAAVAALSPAVSSVSSSTGPSSGAAYRLLQMNLCLSGQAGCYSAATHQSIVDEATEQIADQDPDAVTLNEVCSADAAELARRAGYELSFAAVDYGGTPLPCIEPRGRGLFGIAVLAKDPIRTSQDRAFTAQADPEERRWLCATTSGAVTVCTAHLSTRDSSGERVANDAECRELRDVLAEHASLGTTFFGGDLNRQDSCAPGTMWVTRDSSASKSAGLQHIYGSRSVDDPSASIVEATYTDHDFLLVAAIPAPER